MDIPKSVAAGVKEEDGAGHSTAGFWTLTLGSIGVVYGDIGTSPLYAFREAMAPAAADGIVTTQEVYGVLSLILWALFLIVTVKYVLILLHADNKGEGGTLSLMALARKSVGRAAPFMLGLGIVGAALFYGDAIITPAISVLSAVEGIKIVTPAFEHSILPLTVGIILGLFLVQSHGTARVAAFFGPVTLVWFAAIAAMGVPLIIERPEVLRALNPYYAVEFIAEHGIGGLLALGAVFLAVTGAEALYADLGHFGRRPIQFAWLAFVFPALALNYFGQAALVLNDPSALENPFYLLAPGWALLPMVILATAATVIASQAVITGAYSLSRQAIQLGLLPRFEIRHTSEAHSGQIYMPRINGLLMVGVLMLVVMFRSSSSLAHAYGIAVTGTMVVTAMMAFVVIWKAWQWSLWAAVAIMLPFFLIDSLFLSANLLKVVEGGYVPLMLGGLLILMMWTWVKGTAILFEKTRKVDVPLAELVQMLEKSPPHRIKGTAVFLTSDPDTAPSALLHNLKHNKVLHEKNCILTVRTADMPRVPEEERVRIEPIAEGFTKVEMTFGYMETPNVPKGLAILRKLGFKFDIMATSFFLSRRSIRPAAQSGMPLWQDRLFIALAKNANDATDFFQIPTGRVVEVGTQVTV
ncbi:potassium transporter Kup [Chelatococcus sp. SYSU_G07232]|uniref:Probable potassium transport system protein Kup n=1 Tax=Chelatococcus albus TaxID=3047466 RepID=A0ABT7AFS5_9HYPH|nr:potassium transporter Kup [Chelatococcus sp. SYSU_G07232]MDJ1157481.1 potassium transporter Kup [Chelatococcus sp. SYSU_G07232]